MQLTPAALAAIYTNFSAIFQQALTNQPVPWYMRMAMTVPSTSRQNTYGWMMRIPRIREWLGERVVHSLAAHGYTIVNKDWEETIGIDRNDIEDDQFGLYTAIIQELARQFAFHPNDLITSLLQTGASTTCFDGQYFFDTDHPIDLKDSTKGTQSNLFTSTALSLSNYQSVRASMAQLKGEDERPLGIRPTMLVVPPQLEGTGKTILVAQTQASGATNVEQGSAELVVVPELANEATTWYLVDGSRAIKPFVYQLRRGVEFVSKDSPDDDNVFRKKEFLYGADCRDNAGYGLYQLIAKAVA